MYIIKLTTWHPDEGRCHSGYLKQLNPLLTFSTRLEDAKQYERKKDALADIIIARRIDAKKRKRFEDQVNGYTLVNIEDERKINISNK